MATLVKLRKLTTEERAELERLARSRTEEARLVVRARIVLGWPPASGRTGSRPKSESGGRRRTSGCTGSTPRGSTA